MRIIIAGGSGLVGSALARDLAGDGHEVHILTRNPDRARPEAPGISYVGWDARSAAGWGHLADGSDAIVNLAGETIGGRNLVEIFGQRWTPTKKRRILDSRLDAGRAVTEAIRVAKTKPKTLIQMSAVGRYGPRGDERLDETASAGIDFLARVAQAWEDSTTEVESFGVRRVITRTGLVLSTRGGLFPVVLLPFRLLVGGRLGSGRQGFSWIHAADQRRALRFLIENPEAHGAFNLTAPDPVAMSDLGRQAARALRRPYWFPTPGFLLKLVLGEKSMLVLDGLYVIPGKLQQAGFTFEFPGLGPALADLTRRQRSV